MAWMAKREPSVTRMSPGRDRLPNSLQPEAFIHNPDHISPQYLCKCNSKGLCKQSKGASMNLPSQCAGPEERKAHWSWRIMTRHISLIWSGMGDLAIISSNSSSYVRFIRFSCDIWYWLMTRWNWRKTYYNKNNYRLSITAEACDQWSWSLVHMLMY